jgi:hypothetical protein
MLFSFLYLAVRALFGLLIRCRRGPGVPAAKSTAATASAAYSTSTSEPPHEVRHE